ncbi:hypothetical protein BBO99_00006735 [Phytophthora kernoviae]|uniref:Uncharacterized protein n=1 Tax=Phytophthora kernoviae TaxID=325452 RepID=A0A3R7J178_9STRA|nr:hypothetical protein BBI17_006757 [Phytophthora kernoviae]RLN77447.1 hypothetical protein BBO99_00006735 [Phytophthora kernoviae]
MSTSSSKPSASAGGTSPPADKHSADEDSSAGKRISVHDYHGRQHKKRSGRADAPENTDSHDEASDSASSEPKVVTALGREDKTESLVTDSRRQRVDSLEEGDGARSKRARSDVESVSPATISATPRAAIRPDGSPWMLSS